MGPLFHAIKLLGVSRYCVFINGQNENKSEYKKMAIKQPLFENKLRQDGEKCPAIT